MQHNAALLIDLENFFLAREALDTRSFRDDIEQLSTFVKRVTRESIPAKSERRLIVQRAYANFSVSRGDYASRDYYLQRTPDLLMEFGIEPVQVFPFRKGTNKNAVDMRIAMDATSLISTRSPVAHFILVTGDSDFIPVVVELKRHGPHVTVIGVKGSTSELFARYCDSFEYFEDLLAADELAPDLNSIGQIGAALGDLLAKAGRIKFAAVKPLLTRALGKPFDPTIFTCENTGDFLRRYSETLGIQVQRGEFDWEIRPESSDTAFEPAVVSAALAPPSLASQVDIYRRYLKSQKPMIFIVPPDAWVKITELAHEELLSSARQETPFHYRDLQERLIERAGNDGIAFPDRTVPATMFQLYAASCFVSADPDDKPLETSFHWDKAAYLHSELTTVEQLRGKVQRYVLQVLRQRGRAVDPAFAINAEALGLLLFGNDCPTKTVDDLRKVVMEVTPAT